MAQGKPKGDRFENDVCRFLTRWYVGQDAAEGRVANLPFRRRFTSCTPMEGHWESKGDILHQPGIDFPYAVECKNDESWKELDGMFCQPKWPVWKWWEQCKRQALAMHLAPLLIFTRNRRRVLTIAPEEYAPWASSNDTTETILNLRRPDEGGLVLAPLEALLSSPPPRSALVRTT